MQDGDQTVGQSSQSLMMSLAAGAQDVVSMPGAFGASEGRERPLVAGIGEPAVARHLGENDLASTGGLGDGRGARIALASLRMQESGSVITELGHSPGAEDKTESRQTEVDLGVRVQLKLGEKRRRLQLRQSQLGLDLSRLCLQVSLPAALAKSRVATASAASRSSKPARAPG